METNNLNDIVGGLTTKDAIYKLHQDIQEFLDNFEVELIFSILKFIFSFIFIL